ncbi:MAG: hypothetical protein ASARMPREDX12_006825 [Alectoria sarmentosa]|nr:MAG: hypothetical protein ASARMPREDX12_006825 [Alectoria sarmentosa]
MSTSNLWDHSNNLKENLLAIRSAAQVVVDANRAKFSLPLPVHSLIFLGAPHRGLETTALKTLVEGTASANMIRDLEEGSNTLAMLDDDFKKYHQESSIHILSFYELYKTPTAHQSSDGSWKRDGVPKMMVTRDRAHLGYEDTILGVYANHSEIAKIDLSSNSQFLFIKQAIDQVLLKTSEQGVFLGLSPFQSSEDAHSLRSKSAVTLPGETERPITRSGPDHREQHSRSTPTIVLGRSRKPTPEAQSSDLDRMNMRRGKSDSVGVADLVLDSTGNEEVVDGGEKNRFTTLQPGATHSRVLELLLKHEADVGAITTKASGARTPVRLALQYCGKTYYSHRKYPELLAKYGANMEQPDGNGDTPLHWAAKNAVPEIVE